MAGRKVLLIIDIQRGFIKKGMDKVVSNIQAHLAKNSYDMVIQSRWENYMGSQYERILGYTALGNSEQTEMLITSNQDHIISRCQYSCVTEKFKKLVTKEDSLYVVGVDTDACVLATLYDLWDEGYKFHVIKNCVDTSAKHLRVSALDLIARNFGKECLI